jgi:hypothetical protein
MTEAELIFQIAELIDRLWNLQQWWASISFGVLIVAHIGSNQLNIFLVAVILFLYTIYSVFMLDLLGHNFDIYIAFVADLQRMSDSGIELTSGAVANIVQPELGYSVAPAVFLGTKQNVFY